MVFLSGHGTRDPAGNFYFVPYDVDLEAPGRTCVPGEALKPGISCVRKSLRCSSSERIRCTPAALVTPRALAHVLSRVIQRPRPFLGLIFENLALGSSCERVLLLPTLFLAAALTFGYLAPRNIAGVAKWQTHRT